MEAFLEEPADNSYVLQEQVCVMSRLGDIQFETGKTQQSLGLFKQSLETWTGHPNKCPMICPSDSA